MKIIIAASLLSLSAFAVENCKEVIGQTAYNGKITQESNIISYGGCPDSVLVNDSFVARLARVKEKAGKVECSYSSKNVSFTCEAN